ncbi:DMT family transporter [Sphingobacterium thalpophilum]|uniref:DMT family transporter n=1 Tax=Sphingobacterium thalpophilum TaxID=259 RepID=UPI0024A6229D|nr:DMT family transporter [Sphingobacterium thalpophilum]
MLALVTGALIPIQAATNAAFSKAVGNSIVTGLSVFLIGLAGMVVYSLVVKTPLPTVKQLGEAPLYSYMGGLIIALYVVMITILVPRIGVGTAIGLIVTGQIIGAVLIDHFGLCHVIVRPLSAIRLTGVILMIVGVYCVMRK